LMISIFLKEKQHTRHCKSKGCRHREY
jgi:hypothetical protein